MNPTHRIKWAGQWQRASLQVIFKTEILNEHLICSLCMGYFRDAQSVTECLHTCTCFKCDRSMRVCCSGESLSGTLCSLQSLYLQIPAFQQRQGRSMPHVRRCFGTGALRKSPVRYPFGLPDYAALCHTPVTRYSVRISSRSIMLSRAAPRQFGPPRSRPPTVVFASITSKLYAIKARGLVHASI
jgi:hypothetical protein